MEASEVREQSVGPDARKSAEHSAIRRRRESFRVEEIEQKRRRGRPAKTGPESGRAEREWYAGCAYHRRVRGKGGCSRNTRAKHKRQRVEGLVGKGGGRQKPARTRQGHEEVASDEPRSIWTVTARCACCVTRSRGALRRGPARGERTRRVGRMRRADCQRGRVRATRTHQSTPARVQGYARLERDSVHPASDARGSNVRGTGRAGTSPLCTDVRAANTCTTPPASSAHHPRGTRAMTRHTTSNDDDEDSPAARRTPPS
ncbi:hypothetical protein EXIGLDRAFT_215583 [Exidia glandulosa HHB12029]|uniref:Uncharacterized protein n=1 Tax=Exidia glandulosa HHB12029 TaxID=1314781 RepID=A0A165EGT3_EXIGL|nr:hypothetical protein EXIGLDRAFT_215583 [Exidia glandulosa HHB12029]